MSVIAEDLKQIQAGKSSESLSVSASLVKIARETGQSPISLGLDFRKLNRGKGKLRFYEYVMYDLYDREKWSEGERENFISAHIHWPTVMPCNSKNWWAVTEDKWLSAVVLEKCGLPTPKTLAVFDRSLRRFPNLPQLKSSEDLKAFLSGDLRFPLFAKNMNGMWSAGAFVIQGVTDSHVLIEGKESATFEELAGPMLGDASYIIQECLTPHSFFDGITDATATVRCVNLIGDDGLSVPFAVLKLPLGGNIADNFWRSGNVLCDLDPETGEIRGIVEKRDGKLHRVEALPISGKDIIGTRLPDWDRLREVNETTALLHAANHYGSTDIALTKDGPVIVEVNNGSAFELVQIATGKGFLTPEIRAFFGKHGVEV